jgi:lipoprotein-anchoring transpeptidase ErfK/SrfK
MVIRLVRRAIQGRILTRHRALPSPLCHQSIGRSEHQQSYRRGFIARSSITQRSSPPEPSSSIRRAPTLTIGQGKAIRYGIGVGREGFTWSGTERISRMKEWPDWLPPKQMIQRQPYLPRFMAGGETNPLGARAMYLGNTEYRIHGTNQPSTIGTFVSSGCIRLTNEDVEDLYSRVTVGTRVIVLPGANTAASQLRQR